MSKEYLDFSWLTFSHFLRRNNITMKSFVETTGVSDAVLRRADKNKRIDKKYADMIAEYFDIHDVFDPETTKKVTRYRCLAFLDNNMKVSELRFNIMTEPADVFKLTPNTIYCNGYRLICHIESNSLKGAMDIFMNNIKEYL